jgi:DNA polymerase-3 subunit gamma/tau
MTYQVIARKWRPQTFEEVTGQEPITRTLRNAIEHERLHHAYLFSGARGVGKTTTARLLAKALNCHRSDKPTATPCAITDPAACPSCREIAEGRSIDVMEIDAASNTGVGDVRDSIIGTVGIAPARDRYKVFIIDEVHMLSPQAFNALLKTLEEPPPRVVFILATTERHKLPETILSRVQQFEFRTIAAARIVERLRMIADAEQIKIADDALKEIARAGEGSMRDAQSAFDQVISFSGDEIRTEDVETALGLAGTEMLSRTVRAIADRNPSEALLIVDELVMKGHDLRNFSRDLLAHFRDLLVTKVAGEKSELLGTSGAAPGSLAEQAAAFSESDLVRFFHSLSETEAGLKAATQPRYQLELGLIKLMEMRRLMPLTEVLDRLSALEAAFRSGAQPPPPGREGPVSASSIPGIAGGRVDRRSQSGHDPETSSERRFPASAKRPSNSVEAPSSVVERAPAPPLTLVSPQPASQPVPAGVERGNFAPDGSVIQKLKGILEDRKKMLIVTAIEGANRAVIDSEEFYIEFSPALKHLRDSLSKPENVKILREACREVLGRDVGVRFAVKEPNTDDAEPPSEMEVERQERLRLREMAEQNPAVQQLLKTFHGEIVDVRKLDE